MANGTRNVFVTKTQNRFLPIIQAFTDNMYRHIEAQGNLADKMYAFEKKKQGEQFAGEYGKRISQAKNIKELSTSMTEAFTEATSRGFTNVIPQLQTIAQTQQALIGEQRLEQQAIDYEKFLSGQFGEQSFAWDGEEMTGNQIIEQLKGITDPVIRYNMLSKLPELALEKIQGVVTGKNGYYVSSGKKDAFGNIYGGSMDKIVSDRTGAYIDTDKSGNVTEEDEPLNPLLAGDYTSAVEKKRTLNKQSSVYNKPTSLGLLNEEGKLLFTDSGGGAFYYGVKDGKLTGEKIYEDRIGKFSKPTTPPKKGELITATQYNGYGKQIVNAKVKALEYITFDDELDRSKIEIAIGKYNENTDNWVALKDIGDTQLERRYNELVKETTTNSAGNTIPKYNLFSIASKLQLEKQGTAVEIENEEREFYYIAKWEAEKKEWEPYIDQYLKQGFLPDPKMNSLGDSLGVELNSDIRIKN